jgi:hypothetical protein
MVQPVAELGPKDEKPASIALLAQTKKQSFWN